MSENYQCHGTAIHGCAIVLQKFGILILGKSQSGKSSLANALIHYAQTQNIFSCWVGDDQLNLQTHNNRLIAKPMIRGKAEKFGFGIEDIKFFEAAIIDLAVELKPQSEIERMPCPKTYKNFNNIHFNKISCIEVPEQNMAIAIPIIFSTLNFSLAR